MVTKTPIVVMAYSEGKIKSFGTNIYYILYNNIQEVLDNLYNCQNI